MTPVEQLVGAGTLHVPGIGAEPVCYRIHVYRDARGRLGADGQLAGNTARLRAAWFFKGLCPLDLQTGDRVQVRVTDVAGDTVRFAVEGPIPGAAAS